MPPVNKNNAVARTHSDSLSVICAVCWRKQGSVRKVSEKIEELVKEHVFGDYQRDNGFHPSVICDGCRKTLLDISKVYKLLFPSNHILF